MIVVKPTSRVLDRITCPGDLKGLSTEELTDLASEIRRELITTVASTGGHLAPNLGIVELTLGLLRALDMPRDVVAFDVGHQSYVHKLLTGRRDRFSTLRCYGGLSGFPNRSESPYDLFGSGHASDSISIALGYALARDARGGDEAVVAVIGDGSMTGGMAFEAINHLGHTQTRMTVLLNDNAMSIARNVGALATYLGKIRLGRRYQDVRDRVQDRLDRGRFGHRLVQAGKTLRDSLKMLVVPGMFFEDLGINYVGPIDGHDIEQVEAAVRAAQGYDGPVLIHAVTKKGLGYAYAADQPEAFHGVGPFDEELGCAPPPAEPKPPAYTEVFAEAVVAAARRDERIVAITAAMPSGTGLDRFARAFPDRFFDVGIAEQHAVGLAAGLALGGRIPVVAIYSTFLQRAFDMLVGDVSLQKAHVVFAIDRAGFVGDDGPTHHGVFDLTYLRAIPGLRIMAPADEAELVHALNTALLLDGPVAVRYPRGVGQGVPIPGETTEQDRWVAGRSVTLREGTDLAILAVGRMVGTALLAADLLQDRGISSTVVNARWVKPLDEEVVVRAAANHRLLVTVEENTVRGGFGAAVLETLSAQGLRADVLNLAVPDEFARHGPIDRLLDDAGLSPEKVASAIAARLGARR